MRMTGRRVYLAIQALLCALLAILLCASAADMYRQGVARKAEHPLEAIFTPEAVAEKLAPLAPLFFFFLGSTAAGLLLGVRGEAAGRAGKAAGDALPPRTEGARSRRGALRAALVVAAIALILAGIFNGGARDVLYKAANICTECIGLG